MTRPVLFVEDNEEDIAIVLRSIEKNHFSNTIIVAHDGKEAVDYLLGGNGKEMVRPELVILDFGVSDMSLLLEEIRQTEPGRLVPVVIFTSSQSEHEITRLYDLGANSILRRPQNKGDFADIMEKVSNYWLTLNEAAVENISS